MKAVLSIAALSVVAASAQWLNLPSAKPNLAAPAPKTAEGKPDLSGVWQADGQTYFFNLAAGLKPGDVVPLPWAEALAKQRADDVHRDDPLGKCLPHGVPRINTNGLFPFKIIQTPDVIVILYEQMNLFRQIFMDGRKTSPDANPTWLGYSTGRWDGDTLVVETSGFNGKSWLDTEQGHPYTEALKGTERFRRINYGELDLTATIDDPKTYAKPWTTTLQKNFLQLGTDILEFVCNENEKDAPHMVGK